MPYILAFKDAQTGTRYKPEFSRQDLSEVKRFMKAYSGLGWFKRRSYIRELDKYGATGHVHKNPREGQCNFIVIRLDEKGRPCASS